MDPDPVGPKTCGSGSGTLLKIGTTTESLYVSLLVSLWQPSSGERGREGGTCAYYIQTKIGICTVTGDRDTRRQTQRVCGLGGGGGGISPDVGPPSPAGRYFGRITPYSHIKTNVVSFSFSCTLSCGPNINPLLHKIENPSEPTVLPSWFLSMLSLFV